MVTRRLQRASACFSIDSRLIVLLLLVVACARKETIVTCSDLRDVNKEPWIFRIYPSTTDAEMIVHVPKESVDSGVPSGNPKGRLHTTERRYEILIPADSGGIGDEAWARMQFLLELDRYSGRGMLEIGEKKRGETLKVSVQCRERADKALF